LQSLSTQWENCRGQHLAAAVTKFTCRNSNSSSITEEWIRNLLSDTW